jgi:hypothetical protein
VVGDAGEEAFEAGRDLGLVSAVRRRSKHFQRNDSALVIATWSKAALSSRLPVGLSRCRSGWPDQTGSAAARRAQLYRWLREVAEQVIVSMAEIAELANEGLLALPWAPGRR